MEDHREAHRAIWVTAEAMLGSRFDALRADIVTIWQRFDEATDGTLGLPHLLSVVHL